MKRVLILLVFFVFFFFIIPTKVFAHCDSLNGPVANATQKALDTGNVNHVLVWVKKKDEDEIEDLFKKTIIVRKFSKEAKELADRFFLETVVRIHRAGEGAPYTGLKPVGYKVEHIVEETDNSIEKGNIDELLNALTEKVRIEIKKKWDELIEKKKHDIKNVEKGREYVEEYVVFVHFIESIYNTVIKGVKGHFDEHHED